VTTPIYVWAVVTDERGVLLLPAHEPNGWTLPGGPLQPDDDTVESAIMRELRSRFRIALPDEPEFLATRYDRSPDGGTVVHNLFHIPTETIEAGVEVFGVSAQWIDPADINHLNIPTWMREGLSTLFEDEDALPSFDVIQLQAGLAQFRPAAPVVIVTGPAGVGKSTVARELCLRFDRAAHINVDLLRDMVVSGYASPIPGESDPTEAEEQIRLGIANAAALARNFAEAGMLAVIDDVIETPGELDTYLDALGASVDLRMITLLADRAILARRDAGRPHDQQMGTRLQDLHHIFMTNGETRGVRLDTSHHTPEDTVDIILEQLEDARVTSTPPTWEWHEPSGDVPSHPSPASDREPE
jgi:ADP-ribose pyrophosphatase YjhB (NUDIX family)/adenylylsulfate kinase-like enzyme